MKYAVYTEQEIDSIMRMFESGVTVREIAEKFGRTMAGIYELRRKVKNGEIHTQKNAPPTSPQKQQPTAPTKPKELTPREMIKALYDMGYRIENNKLVHYQKHIIELADIIHK